MIIRMNSEICLNTKNVLISMYTSEYTIEVQDHMVVRVVNMDGSVDENLLINPSLGYNAVWIHREELPMKN